MSKVYADISKGYKDAIKNKCFYKTKTCMEIIKYLPKGFFDLCKAESDLFKGFFDLCKAESDPISQPQTGLFVRAGLYTPPAMTTTQAVQGGLFHFSGLIPF